MTAPAVMTGEYHSRSALYAGKRWHSWYLRRAYEETYRAVQHQGCDPLARSTPRVLLCGTGSAETTLTFVRFILNRAPDALITVLDLNATPLDASRRALQQQGICNVRLVQANALQMPFETGAFDLIESDFFLQFFSDEAKPQLFREWARVLDRHAGAIMTRDYVRTTHRHLTLEAVLDRGRQALFRRTLRTEMYGTTAAALGQLIAGSGLQARFVPPMVRGRKLPLVKLIAMRHA